MCAQMHYTEPVLCFYLRKIKDDGKVGKENGCASGFAGA